jgi:hypothetical protein
LGLKEDEINDLCLFREDWWPLINYDALLDPWNNKVNWANIPFSHALLFLIRALIEKLNGRNIVILLPTN